MGRAFRFFVPYGGCILLLIEMGGANIWNS